MSLKEPIATEESVDGDGKEQVSGRSLSQEEIELSNLVPAVYANRFFVSFGPGGVRVTFAEQQDKTMAVRSAVIMSPEDGISLYKTLQGLLEEIEDTLSKLKSIQQQE